MSVFGAAFVGDCQNRKIKCIDLRAAIGFQPGPNDAGFAASLPLYTIPMLLAPICYMQDLFTAPAARGRGIGRRLIEAVYECARSAGSARVYWQTHETNATARALYDQVAAWPGFIVYRKDL